MPPIIPSRLQDQLDFFEQHAPVWVANAEQIGLTTDQATAFETLATNARSSYNAKLSAESAARIANVQMREKVAETRRMASTLIRTIKAFAEASQNPQEIYNLAQIPAPQSPKPAPPPAKPTDLSVELEPTTGALRLRWKAANPPGTTGTSYIIRRRTSPTAEFQFVGATGTKSFVDSTFFAGPDSVQYTVQGQRADAAGPISPVFTVNFGRAPGGGLTATVTSGDVKLAA
jgi:hypothetical protein